MAMLSVNGAAIDAPSEMKLTVMDVSSGVTRSASGHAVLDKRGVKRVLALRWARMSAEALSALLAQAGNGGFFEVSYPDPESGRMRTMTCYAGDRAMGVLRMMDGAPVWTDIEMTWTER